MKTILIVEDEKLIRQGIKTMIQRSGVPVEVIMECSNGESALEVVREQDIDVMFTDIRMPKMDGIELVRRIHEEVDNPPIIVAISGYDDFSYAVEMMRNGVREYILKPVEREKIVEVLTMLEREITQRQEHYHKERKIGIAQIRHIITDEVTEDEMTLLIQKYEKAFWQNGYFVLCAGRDCEIEDSQSYYLVPEMEEGTVVVVPEDTLDVFLKSEMDDRSVGISRKHFGIVELKNAYEEAKKARAYAYCAGNQSKITYDDVLTQPQIRPELKESGDKFMTETSRMQRLQLIGTEKTDELTALWDRFFLTVHRGYIQMADFNREMTMFLSQAKEFYRNSFREEDEEAFSRLRQVMCYENLDEFEEEFSSWMISFHERIHQTQDMDSNQKKIAQAVDYIKNHFRKDLNMAVVSNEISMNYTMFSYSFKQYTGKNFKDFMKEVRMGEARRLLEETDMRITDIGEYVGYENEKTFLKVFRQCCGVSPSEYRKNVLR